MYCFLCGTEVEDHEYTCHRCGADILFYRQILYTSDVLYNQGLEKASVRDLSGAINSLKGALQFNKANTKARDLLGLCYFEIGESVRAFNEWIIANNMDPNDPYSTYYLNDFSTSPAEMEKINSTIKKYNQALEYCNNGSRDLAMIQLKKVLSVNPKLVAAHQLVALLYIMEGDYHNARRYLQNANYIDSKNTITQRYMHEVRDALREINAGKKKPKRNELAFNDVNDINADLDVRGIFDGVRNNGVNIALGLLIGFLISFFIIRPTLQQSQTGSTSSALVTANEQIRNLKNVNQALEQEVDNLGAKLEEYEGQNDIKTSYNALSKAEIYALGEDADVQSAMEQLNLVNINVLDEDAKARYDKLKVILNPNFADEYFKEGRKFYDVDNYTNAASNFRQCVEIDEHYGDGEALYMLADSIRLGGHSRQAVDYYQKVVDLYPESIWANTAHQYINIVTEE